MSERTIVVIFFFWALLNIITPTLVHLSETSKHGLDSDGKIKAKYLLSLLACLFS